MSRSAAEVSICIPAWNSRDFIATTLRHAREQTHPHLRILVAVDHGADDTAAICAAIARDDPRVEMFAQAERLGWAGNVNFLLDRVRTPFFMLYFHDDVLLPRYVERLLEALAGRPDAGSAHCDMGHFGASDHVSKAVAYPAGAALRLAWFLLAPERGSPLRSLTRSALLDAGLRLPTDAVDGLWANEPYLMRLLAAGPAVAVGETLYLRWDKRTGGLTDGWNKLSLSEQYSGFRANIGSFLSIIDATPMSGAERQALRSGLVAHFLARIRALEADYGCTKILPAGEIHPAFADLSFPGELMVLGPQVEAWARQRVAGAGSNGA
jgi:glycosyltransferase involved in cell wall biosynthesis